MIKILSGKTERIDRRETLRYLGYAGVKNYEGIEWLLDECENMLLPVLAPKAVYKPFNLARYEEDPNKLDLGFAVVESKSLSRNLEGCDKIVLFAATVGPGVDRLILKYNKLSPSRAVVLQAMGAAAVEQWCDELNEGITAQFGESKPRFSCGYGDLPLKLQREIFPALSVTSNIGVTLTEGDLMMPTKSVTAIVGIKQNQE